MILKTLPSDNSKSNSASFSRTSSDRLDKSTSKSIVMYTFSHKNTNRNCHYLISLQTPLNFRVIWIQFFLFCLLLFCNTHTQFYWKKLWKMLALWLKNFFRKSFYHSPIRFTMQTDWIWNSEVNLIHKLNPSPNVNRRIRLQNSTKLALLTEGTNCCNLFQSIGMFWFESHSKLSSMWIWIIHFSVSVHRRIKFFNSNCLAERRDSRHIFIVE